jgi:hypothetical protein
MCSETLVTGRIALIHREKALAIRDKGLCGGKQGAFVRGHAYAHLAMG